MTLILSGCASHSVYLVSPVHAKNEKDKWNTQLKEFKASKVRANVASYMQQHSYIDSFTVDGNVGLCNYFLKNSCAKNNAAKEMRVELGFNSGYRDEKGRILRSYGRRTKKEYYIWDDAFEEILKNGDTSFRVTVTGISTKQQITIYPSRHNEVLHLGRSFRGRLSPDHSGYIISGSASIKFPDKFLEGDSKDSRLVVPIKFGSSSEERTRAGLESKAYAHQKTRNYNHNPDSYKTKYFGVVTGFKLYDKFAEYAVWINKNDMYAIKKGQEAEKRRLIAKIKSVKRILRNSNLVKQFTQYSEVDEICYKLNKDSNRVSNFECSTYNARVKSRCKRKKQKYKKLFQNDISEICPIANNYRKQFISKLGPGLTKAIDLVLSEYKNNNSITDIIMEREFPYTQLSTRQWRTQFENAGDRMFREETKAIQAKSDSSFRRSLMNMGKPSKIYLTPESYPHGDYKPSGTNNSYTPQPEEKKGPKWEATCYGPDCIRNPSSKTPISGGASR